VRTPMPYNDSMESAGPRHIGDLMRNIEIVGADPVTRHGFTQVPNFILTKKDISVGAKLAYAMLLKYAWGDDACFPGQVKLAEDMGATDRSVRTYLKELETAELLEITQRGLGKTNLYRLHLTVKSEKAKHAPRS
jgi:Helix-turn-helix domain